jgi:hypothetical protein
MKFRTLILAATLISLPMARPAAAKDSPKPDKDYLGVDLSKGHDNLDMVYYAPGFSFDGKSVRVKEFKMKADKPESGDCDLEWKEAGEFIADAFTEETADHLKETKLTRKGSGTLTLEGQITEFGCPKRGAAWGGWIGELGGQGGITFDMKVVDSSGTVVAAAHHRLMVGASYSMRQRIRNTWNDSDKVVGFFRHTGK